MRRDARGFAGWNRLAAGFAVVAACSAAAAAGRGRDGDGTVSRAYIEARDLFSKVWTPNRAGGAGGDGLGPLYNADSCVACHHQGGPGGGGPNDRNVMILTASIQVVGPKGPDAFRGLLEALHPGFKDGPSVVLHRRAVSPADEGRLEKARNSFVVRTSDGMMAFRRSERNTPSLFGSGRIDAIPEQAILDAASRRFADFPEIKGRVSLVEDGRIGRFGWKGQIADLRGFVLAACSNELGLEVAGHHQPSLAPSEPDDPAPRPDMDEAQSDLLVTFVRDLPRPVFRVPGYVASLRYGADGIAPERGRAVFDRIGCATCHAPKLGDVDGLYSDLLLHDIGGGLRDSGGSYGGPSKPVASSGLASRPPFGPAGETEWRTPPLWGVAGSAPYLHDGRAATLDEAIRLHGGEAEATRGRYVKLARVDEQSLLAFLHSLAVPSADATAARPPRSATGRRARPRPSVPRASGSAP